MNYILDKNCSEEDIFNASKEMLFYTWKQIEKGNEYPFETFMLIAKEMTFLGM